MMRTLFIWMIFFCGILFVSSGSLAFAGSCVGDFDFDGDVDGIDLKILTDNYALESLEIFSENFGRIDCSVPALRIANTASSTASWDWKVFLAAEILDNTNSPVTDATVWVIAPDGSRIDLNYEFRFDLYNQGREVAPILGDYTFYAEFGGNLATPVIHSLTSDFVLGGLNLSTCPNSNPTLPVTIEWEPVSNAQGYFVTLENVQTGAKIWSNVNSFFDPLPNTNFVTIPSGVTESDTLYAIYVIGVDSVMLKDASAVTANRLEWSPGIPFNMGVSLWAHNSCGGGKRVTQQVFVEDCQGERIQGAQVWAITPTGKYVPFVHNINGWYESTDQPDPYDSQTYGIYTFHVEYDEKYMSQQKELVNFFIDVPQNIQISPWPLIRGQEINVSFDPIPGAVAYNTHWYETLSWKILYHSDTSSAPAFTVPATIWSSLIPGNSYTFLVAGMNAEEHHDSTATSNCGVYFVAP
jgi:hypothetical protein